MATTVAGATAGGGKKGSERSVFVQAEEERQNNGQTATAEYVRAERAVFRTEYKQSNENPKGKVISLGATIHKKPPVFCRRGYVFRLFPSFEGKYLRFYLSNIIVFLLFTICVKITVVEIKFSFFRFILLRKLKKCGIIDEIRGEYC